MTSVFMVLEVSGNYSIIVPVIVANTFAYVISRSLQPTPIFDLLTRQDGLDLPSMEEQREVDILRVEDAMESAPGPVLNAEESVGHALQRLDGSSPDNLLVHISPAGWNIISKRELRIKVAEGNGELSVRSILKKKPIPFLHPDQSLDTALRYVDQWCLLPVVSRADLNKLEGVISQESVLKRYSVLNHEIEDFAEL
jgi:chloride channel protein, CIC family